MILLILALNLLLNLSDPSNDGYGDASLVPPTDIIYRSASAIDIVDFEIKNSPRLSFSISFSDLDKADLKNGFLLPIIEVYFQDNSGSGHSNQLLPGSGMALAENESWHYAFQISGDYVKLFENSADGIKDISSEHKIDLKRTDNTITVSSDLKKPGNLVSYLMAGNYNPFNKTGWREIAKQPNPWAYSSPTQTVRVVDLFAGSPEIQKQAIDSAILPAAESPKDGRNLWRWVMIWGLTLAILGFLAKFLAKSKEGKPAPKTNLAERARAATIADNYPPTDSEKLESSLLAKLDVDIKEYEKTFEPPLKNKDIEIEIAENENINGVDTASSQEDSSGYRSLAPLPAEGLEFELNEGKDKSEQQALNKDKKKDKIKVYNLAEQKNKKNKNSKKAKKQRSDMKKPLVVVPIENEGKKIDKSAEKNKPEKKTKPSEISFSLGDAFWDNFEKSREVSWKPKDRS